MLVINIHDLSPQPVSEWSFAPDELKWLLDFLLQRGYQFIPLEDWSDNRTHSLSCALTFDDCRLGAYRYAPEILSARNIKASFYPVSNYLQGADVPTFEAYSQFATEIQIKDLLSAGHRLGSHGKRHLPYFYLSQADIFEDLKAGKSELEKIFGGELSTISVPYGQLNADVVRLAKKVGYKQILSADSAWNKAFLQLPFLRRISLRSGRSREAFLQELLEVEAYRDELLIADCMQLPVECWEWPLIYRVRAYDLVLVGNEAAKTHLERYGVWNVLVSTEDTSQAVLERFLLERSLPGDLPQHIREFAPRNF